MDAIRRIVGTVGLMFVVIGYGIYANVKSWITGKPIPQMFD